MKAETKVRLGGKQVKWEIVEGYSMNNMILLAFLEASAFSYASRYIKLEKLITLSAFEIYTCFQSQCCSGTGQHDVENVMECVDGLDVS